MGQQGKEWHRRRQVKGSREVPDSNKDKGIKDKAALKAWKQAVRQERKYGVTQIHTSRRQF